MIYAKPSTALLVMFKAYLASDHVSSATGKTIAITISKNGGAFGNPNAGATNATEVSSGWYKVTLDTTDTGTAGPLAVRGAEGTIDDVGVLFYVGQAPADVTHFGGSAGTFASGIPEVKVASIANNAITAASIASAALAAAKFAADTGLVPALSGTAAAGGSSTITTTGGSATDDFYKGMLIFLTGGTGAGQSRFISASNGTTKVFTVKNAWAVNPDATSTYVVLPWCPVDVFSVGAVATVAGKVAATVAAGDLDATNSVASVSGAVGSVTGNVGGNVAGSVGSVTGLTASDVGAIKAKTDNLPSDPADASDIASSFSTVNTKLDAIDDFVDSEVAAIKAKTDLIPAAPAAVGDIPTANQNADALLDRADAIETGLTLRQAHRLEAAAAAGKLSGAGTTTVVIRNAVADSKPRMTAGVDDDGNRNTVTTDVT